MVKNSNYKIALYIRVSTEEQAENPEGSIKSQEQRLRDAVTWKNRQSTFGDIVGIYIDAGISAKDMNRPRLQAMLKDISGGLVNLVLVTEISRLSRNNRDFLSMWDLMSEFKCSFMSLREDFDTTSAAGEMLMFQLMNFAQFERKQTSERVAANMLARSSRGLYNGGSVPLGYRINRARPGYLDVDPEQAEIVKLCFDTYLQKGTLSATARWLNDQGHKVCVKKDGGGRNHRHGWFTVESLCKLLKNKVYIGIKVYTQKGEQKEVKAVWEPIIEESLFQRVGEQLDKNKSGAKTARGKNPYPYLLTGVSVCMTCGDHMPGKSATGRNGKVPYYEHSWASKRDSTLSKKLFKCDPHRIPARKVEPLVWAELEKFLNSEGFVTSLIDKVKEMNAENDDQNERKKLKARLGGLNSQMDALAERLTILPKSISPVPLFKQMEKLEEAKNELEEKLLKIADQNVAGRLVPMENFQSFAAYTKKVLLPNSDFGLKRRIMQKFIRKIEVGVDSIKIHWNLDKHHYQQELKIMLSAQNPLVKTTRGSLLERVAGSPSLTSGHPTRT